MNYDVIATEEFEKVLKRLSKKYSSLQQEIIKLGETLSENPTEGQYLGRNCYKI
jgi:mRNA-degrading endonuclease RelE of RelBE toxin-antitoxin system